MVPIWNDSAYEMARQKGNWKLFVNVILNSLNSLKMFQFERKMKKDFFGLNDFLSKNAWIMRASVIKLLD